MNSNKQVLKLLDSRIFFLSGKFMELIEKNIPAARNDEKWSSVRNEILDLTNNIIRANHEDLSDYNIDYCPISIIREESGIKYRFSVDAIKIFNHAVFDEENVGLILSAPSYRTLKGVCDCMNLGDVKIVKKSGIFITKMDFNQCKNNLHILKQISFTKERDAEFQQWCHIIESSKEDPNNAR